MSQLIHEVDSIKRDFPKFRFVCPDPELVTSTKSFLSKSDKELDKIQELLELVDNNPELREILLAKSGSREGE
ncbi:hypothetical protein D3C78_1919730 [compost metagenome]